MSIDHPYQIYRYFENSPSQGDLIWPDVMDAAWPEVMKHSPVADAYFPEVRRIYPDTVFYICDGKTVITLGQSVPLYWEGDIQALPDEGWDWAIKSGVEQAQAGKSPNMLCALEIAVNPDYRGKGLSQLALQTMREIGLQRGFTQLIAPVRPSQKAQYPLVPMEDYIQWKRSDGLLFDAWLRTHQRVGARVIKVAPRSMRFEGTVAEWTEWSGLEFPGSGQYVVAGLLNPLEIDCDADQGVYIEPNVWMLHSLV